METQKIYETTLTIKIQNLRRENGMILTVNQKVFIHTKMKSSLCDYSDAYTLVTGNVTVAGGDANTKFAFKNCAPFEKSRTAINETFIDKTRGINS